MRRSQSYCDADNTVRSDAEDSACEDDCAECCAAEDDDEAEDGADGADGAAGICVDGGGDMLAFQFTLYKRMTITLKLACRR